MSLLDELKAVEPGYNGVTAYTVEDEVDNIDKVSDEYTGEGRWETYHTAVFYREGDATPYVALDYAEPATEMQDGQDYGDPTIYEVRPVEVTVTKYQKV